MFKVKRYLLIMATNIVLVAAIVFFATRIIPVSITGKKYAVLFIWLAAGIISFVLSLILFRLKTVIYTKSVKMAFTSKENAVLYEFIENLRACSSLDDFYENVGEILEEKGDCSVLFVDREKDYVLYNSPDKLTCNQDVINTLDLNFKNTWRDGCYFIGDDFGIVSKPAQARGFFIVYNQITCMFSAAIPGFSMRRSMTCYTGNSRAFSAVQRRSTDLPKFPSFHLNGTSLRTPSVRSFLL